MLNKFFLCLIVLTIVIVNVLRFWDLDKVPNGYNVDELSGAVSVRCLATEGTDAHLIPHPIFFDQHYGTPKPPVYAYPAAAWTKIFGYTVDKLRAFTAFANVFAIIGLFLLGRLLFGNIFGLIAALMASVSPWVWMLSRIGYESTFSMGFIVWGLLFFLSSNQWRDKIIAALFFACALYSYPPARMEVPLLLLTLFAFDIKRQGFKKSSLIVFILALIIPCIPLVQKTLTGELQTRFNSIAIFASDYLKEIGKTSSLHDLSGLFISNYLKHFGFNYLFITGDPSYEHSTQHFGLLGWLDMLGLVALIFMLVFHFKKVSKDGWLLIFLVVNFFLAIIPAALTNSGLPSSLRTIMAFPFLCILATYGLWQIHQLWRFALPVITCIGILFGVLFLRNYFTVYPDESKGWFSYWTRDQALSAKTDEDWLKFMATYVNDDYHFRYYMMAYHGETCTSSRQKWQKVREILHQPKIY